MKNCNNQMIQLTMASLVNGEVCILNQVIEVLNLDYQGVSQTVLDSICCSYLTFANFLVFFSFLSSSSFLLGCTLYSLTLLWLHHIEFPITQPQMQVSTQILTNQNAVDNIEIIVIYNLWILCGSDLFESFHELP